MVHVRDVPRSARRGAAAAARPLRWVIAIGVVAVLEFRLARATAENPRQMTVLVLGGVAVAGGLAYPLPILLAAFPTSFAYWRVGPAAIDMSITDAVTLVAMLAALPFLPWRRPEVRRILVVLVAYLVLTGVSVIVNPSPVAAGEVFHRFILVGGAMFIGVAVAMSGKIRLALRLFLIAAAVVAAAAIVNSVTSGFEAAYPFGMHKNAAGVHLASGLIILLAAHRRVGLRISVSVSLGALLGFGLLATQSRGAMIGFVAATGVYLLRTGGRRAAQAAPMILLAAILLLGFAFRSFQAEQNAEQVNQRFTPLNLRLDSYAYAIDEVWTPSPFVGAGPKWFQLNSSRASGPHNIVIAELSETGIVGLVGLAALLFTILRILWRRRGPLADAAFLVVFERVVDSMLGIFWVAGTATFPFLMLGLVLGDDAESDPADAPASRSATV